MQTRVLVVGAGPVGLMLATELQRRGIEHLVIERADQPVRLVKALGITPRTLQMWERTGMLEAALDAGTFLRGNCTLENGTLVDRQEIPRGRFPIGFLTLAQYEAERILRRHLSEIGGEVRRGTALTSFRETGEGVVASVSCSTGETAEIACDYLVGCDGAHSVVRHGLGLDFAGDAIAMTFMLADVAVDWQLERGFVYRMLHLVDGQMVNQGVAVPIPGETHRYRLSMAAPPEYWEAGADLSQAPSLELVTRTIEPMLPPGTRVADLRWSSLYRISHRIASSYARGRVFLVGDAAHIHPPIGGQGMNTGLQDACNLGWKLALAVRGRAVADLLESYDAERRPVGLDVVTRTSRRMEQAIEGTDRGENQDQLQVDSQLDVGYRDSRWVAEDVAAVTADAGRRALRAGDWAPDVGDLRRPWVERPIHLAELLGHAGHTLLFYVDDGTSPREHELLAEIAAAMPRDLVRVHGIAGPASKPPVHERFAWLDDPAKSFAETYGARGTSLYLVRPDGYLGYRSAPVDRAKLDAYLARIFAASGPT